MKLRVSEKKTLNLLNKARDRECVRFPLPTRIMTTEMKINCLIQAVLGCLPIHEPSLKQDVLRIMWVGKRVTNALAQYLLQRPHYQALVSAITLAKCFHCKLWENSPHMTRQLKGIGAALSSMLAVSNKTTFQSVIEANPRDLESILNRPPPTGDNLKAEVNHLPHFELRTESVTSMSVTKLHICAEMTNRAVIREHNTAGENHWIFLLVGDSNNKCIYKERFKDSCLIQDTKCWKVEIKDPSSVNEVYVKLISEQWVGLDVHSSIKLQPREGVPLKVRNSIEKYLKKQGGSDHVSLSSKWSNPQTTKRTKSSFVHQIKDMSEKRLGNALSMTPTKLTLNKYTYSPAKKMKLLPSVDQLKRVEHEEMDALSQFSSSEKHQTEQVNPEISFRHVKPKLITDEQVYGPHKPSSLGHTEQEIMPTQDDNQMETFLQYQSTNVLKGPETQWNQYTVTKYNTHPPEKNTVELQDTSTCNSTGTRHTQSPTAGRTGLEYEAPRPQQPNEMKLSTEPSTSKLTEDCHQPFKENVKLHEDTALQEKHSEVQEINATVNSQLPNGSNLHNNSLMEECSSEESKTEDFNFQNGTDSAYKYVTLVPTLSVEAQRNLRGKYLKAEMLPTNTPTCDNNLGLQDELVASSDVVQSEKISSEGEHHRKNNSVIIHEERAVHASYSPINRENTVININRNVDSLHTKEKTSVRKKLVFQKTLPKHYYPIFIKSLEYDTNGAAGLYSGNCDQSTEASNKSASSRVMKSTTTLPDSGEEVTSSCSHTQRASPENVTERVKKLHPSPNKEANFYTSVQMKNGKSSLLQQSSEEKTEGSLTSENKLQVNEESNPQNEKTDEDDHEVPDFQLVKDIDSFLADISGEENSKFKCANKSNKKCNHSFKTNIPALTRYSARNNYVSRIIPHDSNEDVHRIRRNDSKYKPILNLLLKDVSRTEVTPSSSTERAYEESETEVHSQLLPPEFQFQPTKKGTLSQFTQKSLGDYLNTMLNQNSDDTPPLSNLAQTLQPQSKNCEGKYTQSQVNYHPSVQKELPKLTCDSDVLPGDMNRILPKNETYQRWNNVRTAISVPMRQPSLSRQRESYAHISETDNASSTQPWMFPFEEPETKRLAFSQPVKCVTGNNENLPNLNSQWQKYEMSPIHSDESPEYY